MSAHVLLNLLKELRKSDHKEYIKFNSTGVRILDSIYHMTLKVSGIMYLVCKAQDFGHIYVYATLLWLSIQNITKHVNH